MFNNASNKIVLKIAPKAAGEQKGFALFTTLIVVIVVGIIAVSNLQTTEMTELLSGNSIQRSRAFQAAEGGVATGESESIENVKERVFSSAAALEGVYSQGSVTQYWWRNEARDSGVQVLPDGAFPGVVESPEYVVEEIGNYLADGGSGIVSLDRGAASYGRKTGSGRELVLYRLQGNGVGSTDAAQAVVETLYIKSQ